MCMIPFPSIRRVGAIRRRAATFLTYSEEGFERTLRAQLRQQRRSMLDRGIDPDAVDQDLAEFERAIRSMMTRIAMQSGGVA